MRASRPSVLRPAVGSSPGVARTRPMALRDRGSIRKVATSGPKVRFGHRRPSGLDGGSPLACRLQACPAGEPWHQFVRSGCHAGSAVLSYGRTPLESAIGWLRCLVGSHGVRKMKVAEAARRPTKVGSRDRKVARGPDLRIGMSAGIMRVAAMVEECPNSTLDERPLHCRRLLRRQTRSFWQAVVMKKVDVGTSNRGCGSVTRTHSPRVVSVDT